MKKTTSCKKALELLFYILKEYTHKSKCNLRLATAFFIDDEL